MMTFHVRDCDAWSGCLDDGNEVVVRRAGERADDEKHAHEQHRHGERCRNDH